jgi:hypothetical protein
MENAVPAKRALAALDTPPATEVATGSKRVSKKVAAAIDKMVSGECKKIAEAAQAVGMARESLNRALSKPHVAELMRTKVLRTLAMAAARSVARSGFADATRCNRKLHPTAGLLFRKPSSKSTLRRAPRPWFDWQRASQPGQSP